MPRRMDAKTSWTALLLRAAGIAFGAATQVFFVATVCFLFLFLRDGGSRPANGWLTIDCLLALQFAVVHSVLLLPRARSMLSRVVPSQLYGSLFSATTCLGLWLMFGYWRSSSTIIWDAGGWVRYRRIDWLLRVVGFTGLQLETCRTRLPNRLDAMGVLAAPPNVAAPRIRGTRRLSMVATSRIPELSRTYLVHAADDGRSCRADGSLDGVHICRQLSQRSAVAVLSGQFLSRVRESCTRISRIIFRSTRQMAKPGL